MLSVLIRDCLEEAILMNTHNMQFHDKILKSAYLFSGAIQRISVELKKCVQISHG